MDVNMIRIVSNEREEWDFINIYIYYSLFLCEYIYMFRYSICKVKFNLW